MKNAEQQGEQGLVRLGQGPDSKMLPQTANRPQRVEVVAPLPKITLRHRRIRMSLQELRASGNNAWGADPVELGAGDRHSNRIRVDAHGLETSQPGREIGRSPAAERIQDDCIRRGFTQRLPGKGQGKHCVVGTARVQPVERVGHTRRRGRHGSQVCHAPSIQRRRRRLVQNRDHKTAVKTAVRPLSGSQAMSRRQPRAGRFRIRNRAGGPGGSRTPKAFAAVLQTVGLATCPLPTQRGRA
jgi:hypothetical protein